MQKNEIYVTTDLQDGRLWSSELTLVSPHWINKEPDETKSYTVRTRYRAGLILAKELRKLNPGKYRANLSEEVRALTPGQSAVFYDNDRVVGSGVVI